MNKPHILVVDDDRRIRELLGRYLSQNDFLVTEVENAALARTLTRLVRFDVIVLDIMMPGEDGLSLTHAWQREGFATPVLLLTAKGEAEARIAGLEAGADDYLPKPFEPRELVLRLNAILKRIHTVSPKTNKALTIDGWQVDFDKSLLTRGAETQTLTKAESTLLKIMAQRPGAVFSRQVLADLIQLDGQERTVDVQVTRLRRKIESDPKKPRYLQTARGEGYLLHID
jgi:two-component system, OmpR family, phosphate regulon response regulator OmpR